MSYTVNVENVSKDVRLLDIEEFFEGFNAVDYSIKNGYALVEFKKREDAEDAVKRLDNRKICGQRVLLDHLEPKKERREDYRDEYRREDERYDRRDDRYEERRDYRYEERRDDRYDDRRDDRYDDRYERRRTAYVSDRAGNVFRTERDLQAYRDRTPPSHRDNYSRRDERSRDQEYSRPSGKYKQEKVERTKFSLLCRNLSSTVQWMDLKDLGRRFGEVSYADANKAEHGLGIITFTNREDMIKAYDNLQGIDFFGRRIKVEYEFPETTDPDWAGRINNDQKGRRSRSRSRSVSRSRRSTRSRSASMH